MMSSYILPLEPRIKVAVPTCNPSIYAYHAHDSKGSDHENMFFRSFEAGIDMLISLMKFVERAKLSIGTHEGLTRARLEMKLNLQ